MEIQLKGSKQSLNSIPYAKFEIKQLQMWLSELKDGEELVISVATKRSSNQNRLFHQWVGLIADYIGESPEVVKMYLKCKFLGCIEEEIEGVVYKIPPETSKLNKKQMSDFMQQVYIFATTEMEIKLPTNDLFN